MDETADQEPISFWDKYKSILLFVAIGIGVFAIVFRVITFKNQSKVEFVEQESTVSAVISTESIKAEIAGAVIKPGVYSFPSNGRIQDLLVISGGLSEEADRNWVAKHINLAARIIDGSKVYIPTKSETDTTSQNNTAIEGVSNVLSNNIVNINTASKAELDTLPGVGEITAEKIISNRPYQNINELLSKKAVGQSVFNKIKDQITVY